MEYCIFRNRSYYPIEFVPSESYGHSLITTLYANISIWNDKVYYTFSYINQSESIFDIISPDGNHFYGLSNRYMTNEREKAILLDAIRIVSDRIVEGGELPYVTFGSMMRRIS